MILQNTPRHEQHATHPPALEARIAALEADLRALAEDRRWLVRVVASLAVDAERKTA